MFRLTKDLEYALIALSEISRQENGKLISARTLSERYAIPFKLLARILQRLRADGVVEAVKGPRGGYRLQIGPKELSLGRVMRAVRGEEEKIAVCLGRENTCTQDKYGCIIKPAVLKFQSQWVNLIENTTLDELVKS